MPGPEYLPRHGRGHKLSPAGINYRANIDAMKRAGVTDILSLSAVGSFREELSPGTFVIVDQFIDRTIQRQKSFFGTGMVAHVSMAHPVCARLGEAAQRAAEIVGLKTVRGGTYLAMEGPQFSSLAESELYRSWGCHVIGMTNMPEAKLAREAEICYTTIALVTDYDCWHLDHDSVTVEMIIANLTENAKTAQLVIANAVEQLPIERTCECARALATALMTRPDVIPAATKARLAPIVGKYLK